MKKIIKNSIKCNLCGDIIVSKLNHDRVTCKCGTCSVDGGNSYLKRDYANFDTDFIELSEYIEINKN